MAFYSLLDHTHQLRKIDHKWPAIGDELQNDLRHHTYPTYLITWNSIEKVQLNHAWLTQELELLLSGLF